MWDIKLLLLNFVQFTDFIFIYSLLLFLELISPIFFSSFFIISWQIGLTLVQNLSLFFGLKFCICIAFLILIRGGTPRYRYDFLTKLGWLKFLSLILMTFIFSIFFYFFY